MIELKQPRSGACISLQTSMQKDFIAPERLGMQCIFVQNTEGLYYKP